MLRRGPSSGELSIACYGGWIEFVGGFLIAFGLFTRFAAFIASGEMAVAFFYDARQRQSSSIRPIVNKGELAVVYCFVFFTFSFMGSGPWSLDATVAKEKSATTPASGFGTPTSILPAMNWFNRYPDLLMAAIARAHFCLAGQSLSAEEYKDFGKDRLNNSPRHARMGRYQVRRPND